MAGQTLDESAEAAVGRSFLGTLTDATRRRAARTAPTGTETALGVGSGASAPG